MEDRRIFYYFLLILTLSKECAGSPLERTDKDGNDPINIQSNVTDHNNNNFGYHSIENLIKERGGAVVLCGDKDNIRNLHLENKINELLVITKQQETKLDKIVPLENKIKEQETKLEKIVSLENKINELLGITKEQQTNLDKMYKMLNENNVQKINTAACGGDLAATDNLKYFHSHAGYGSAPYKPGASCEWRIVAPPGHQVRLTFLTFHLEDGGVNCVLDFVVVQEGVAGRGYTIGEYCGDQVPPEIVSTSGALIVYFRTNECLNYEGFSASYQAIKG